MKVAATAVALAAGVILALSGCAASARRSRVADSVVLPTARLVSRPSFGPWRVLPLSDPGDVYAADRRVASAAIHDRQLVYVPNSGSNTVTEIDPRSYAIVRQFRVGALPQHVVPSYDLRTLWVTNDEGNSLTPIDPRTGVPGRPIAVADPYNMYFTPDGHYAVVMAEQRRQVDFRDAQTMVLDRVVRVPGCDGLNHADYTATGAMMLVSCEFASATIVLDVRRERVVRTLPLPSGSSPQDVKLSPDGRVFYVADLVHGGVWLFNARSFKRIGFIRTGAGAHGLYPSRDARYLYVSNRSEGTISVLSFGRRRVVATWRIAGGSPDMGGVSASGGVLWLSGRYDGAVYAIDTSNGKLLKRIPVGAGPHGLCVWPQPGRYSLGHTGIMR
jgi:DNA-binding beta-propeller fold protein YncE